MDQSAGVIADVEPKNEVEVALVRATEEVMSVLATPLVPVVEVYDHFTLVDVLRAYDFGIAHLKRRDWFRWQGCLALAVQADGLWMARRGDQIVALAILWRTKNPHVDLVREVPKFAADGPYAYVAWQWNESGNPRLPLELKRWIVARHQGIEFVCGFDQRARRGKRFPGRLRVHEVHGKPSSEQSDG